MKNLEAEYKKLQQEKVPDLWERIEKNLPQKKKKKKIVSMIPYMSVAAAALFLCILIPGISKAGRGMNNSTEAAFDSAINIEIDAGKTAGTDGFEMQDAMQEGFVTEEFSKEESVEESFKEEVAGNTILSSDMDNGGTAADKNEEMSPVGDMADSMTENIENGMLDFEPAAAESLLQEIYKVEDILSDQEDTIVVFSFADGQYVRALVPRDNDFSFVIGEEYHLVLEQQSGADWDYVVLKAVLK